MTLPTGTITMAQVNAEIGASPTASISMNDTAVRRLAATLTLSPTSPFLPNGSIISMNNLRGRKATIFASGGTVIDSGGYRIHVFTNPGTFNVDYVFPTTADTVEYLVVAGGGGGGVPAFGFGFGAGGGAGGFRTGTGFLVSFGSYPIVVGGGGSAGGNGSPSTFDSITSTGGGNGGGFTIGPNFSTLPIPARSGGSGGGGAAAFGALGNSPPTSPPQGNPGGRGFVDSAGGGGGAGGAGSTLNGGIGQILPWSPPSYGEGSPPSPSTRYFAGGGGGSAILTPTVNFPGDGGLGGGGNGFPVPPFSSTGSVNTGGGGGGGRPPARTGALGGSGIVMIRYPIA